MPFNGQGSHYNTLPWNYVRILEKIREQFPSIEKIPDPEFSTSYNYQIPGHLGQVGIIAAYSRTFCGTCNRIRITPLGELKTCLYDGGVLNIKDMIREGMPDESIQIALRSAFGNRAKDGFAAEKNRKEKSGLHESMATIGG
jgi:cyclic pyranopterin phosphate synthase